nr:hypothetical protein [Tanacetum cinerariifolium]
MGSFIKWFYIRIVKKKLKKSYLEGLSFKVVKVFHENIISLQFQMEECHRLLTDQVDLVDPEGHRLVPDVSKSLPLRGPPGQACSTTYLDQTKFIFTTQSTCGSGALLSDNVWGDLQLDIESYQTKLNLTEPRWDVSDFPFKECYTIFSKPRAVIYIDRNDQKKMLRENKVHKFSDGTLTLVLHKLDHMVKDFRLYQYNLRMENRIWYEDEKRRSEEFMEIIKRRLKIQRIFWSLESFVGRRFRDVDYMTLNRTK